MLKIYSSVLWNNDEIHTKMLPNTNNNSNNEENEDWNKN